MKKPIAILGVLILALSACNSELTPLPTPVTPIHTPASSTPSPTTIIPTITKAATSTAQATITEVDHTSAAEFPITMLNKQQIQEVADCKIQELAGARYPLTIEAADLPGSFTPQSSCDWAVLAFSYAARNDSDSPSQEGMDAYKNAVAKNYGFALAPFMFDYYFGSVPLVKIPQSASQEIEKVEIYYTWTGLGQPSNVEHSVMIEQANTNPKVTSGTDAIKSDLVMDKDLVQDLSKGLTDLLPIDSQVQVVYCYDNYPEWFVRLTYTDGTKIDMKSNSNFLYMGGPWQTEMDGQTYLQASQAFAVKVGKLMKELDLPLGEPEATFCPGGVVFENAFSRFLPPTATPRPDFTMEAIYTAVAQTVVVQMTQMAAETPTPKP